MLSFNKLKPCEWLISLRNGCPRKTPPPFQRSYDHLKGSLVILLVLISSLFANDLKYIANNIRVSPQNNVFDKSNPRDLNFVVHHPKPSLEGIYHQGEPIEYQSFSFVDIVVDEKNLILPFTTKIDISQGFFAGLETGDHELEFRFENGEKRYCYIEIEAKKKNYAMTITNLNVGHGVAVLIQLPNKNILIDTGKEKWTKKRVIPYLLKQGISTIDYLIITHWHDDHCAGLEEIQSAFGVKQVWYNLSKQGKKESGFKHSKIFTVGNEFSIDGANFKVLNAARFNKKKYLAYKSKNFDGYVGKNNRSLSFNMEFNGFIYSHGGDIYQHAQKAILNTFGENTVRTHVYHGNHHFHGGVSIDYLKKTDPYLFITPANPAAYNRDAYTQQVMSDVVPYLEKNSKRYIENLFDFEVGNIIISVNDSTDWRYETEYINSAKIERK